MELESIMRKRKATSEQLNEVAKLKKVAAEAAAMVASAAASAAAHQLNEYERAEENRKIGLQKFFKARSDYKFSYFFKSTVTVSC
jgi:hypothetical protein